MRGQPGPGARAEKRRVDGVVLLDKPPGLSSNAALQRVKRAFRAHKAGHTGTLDPLATGLLPICLGEATKFSQGLLDSDKAYETDVTLGVTTETGDAEGRVTNTQPVRLARDDIERVLAGFRGDIMQVPHKYSAIKRNGRALYDYARAAEAIEIAPRQVRIIALDVAAWESPVLSLRVRCSKGTYIRSLAEDIGAALGCGGHVSALRRVETGDFAIGNAVDLARLEAMSDSERDNLLLPVTALVERLPQETLAPLEAARFTQGLAAQCGFGGKSGDALPDGPVAVYAAAGAPKAQREFLGLGRLEDRDGVRFAVPVRLLSTVASRAQPPGDRALAEASGR